MMAKYIAFLRGINVGNIRIKMPDLKAAFEEMNFTDVKTYLQTGNVVFNSDSGLEDIKVILEKGLSETFHYQAYVLLYPFDTLTNIITLCPFEKWNTHHNYVIFISNLAFFDELHALGMGLVEESNSIEVGNGVLYWRVEIGKTLDTPFAKIMAKVKYKSALTVRNLNTLEKMI
jgi:uncharacterized protein (DUF1697 family)